MSLMTCTFMRVASQTAEHAQRHERREALDARDFAARLLLADRGCDQKALALVVRPVELSRERERVRTEKVRQGTAPRRACEDARAEQAVHLVRSGGDASRRG